MFNNGQPQQAQHYTPEQLLQFAAVQQQQQQQFGLNFNQNPLLYSQGGHPPTHIQTPQNHQMVQQIQQQLAAGQQVGVSVQQQQQINPIFFNQFLAQHQAQQQVQAFGAPQVNANVCKEIFSFPEIFIFRILSFLSPLSFLPSSHSITFSNNEE
jgi:hypothetical protein